MKIADIIRRGIAMGSTNTEILEAVKSIHPTANTSAACVAYYRSKEKKVATPKPAKAAQAVSSTIATTSSGPTYTVKGLKTFIGMEGHGYNATLYRDGKKVAFVIDDATGGEVMIEWVDTNTPMIMVDTLNYKGEPWVMKMTHEQKILHDFVSTMPATTCDWIDPTTKRLAVLPMTSDLYIENLVNDALLLKDIAKMTNGKIAFVKGGSIFTIKYEATPANITKVLAANPGAVIINGMSDVAALAAVRASE